MHKEARKILAAIFLQLSSATALGSDSYTKIHFLGTFPGQPAYSF